MQRGERRIKVANGVEAQVEAIRDLSLELDMVFYLSFRMFYLYPLCEET